MKKWISRIAIAIIILLVILAGAFVVWGANGLGPMPEAESALESSEMVLVETDEWLVFQPAIVEPEIGLIYYPGGRVDPVSYAPMAKSLAEQGYLVVITPMPLNFAFMDVDQAGEVIGGFPKINKWVIGGHSLGGAMAAEYLYENPDQFDGLILFASYSAESTDLGELEGLPVLSIFGSEDGGVVEIHESVNRLPNDVMMVEIDGGNHAQFGWYGPQSGDGDAAISRGAQQTIILDEVIKFLESIEGEQ